MTPNAEDTVDGAARLFKAANGLVLPLDAIKASDAFTDWIAAGDTGFDVILTLLPGAQKADMMALVDDTAAPVTPLFDGPYWMKSCGNPPWPSHPLLHFIGHWHQTRSPFSPFVSIPYLAHQLNTSFQDEDPLSCYYRIPPVDRPDPHPLFDGHWYRKAHDIAANKDAFEHFLQHGLDTGLVPNPYAFHGYRGTDRHIPKPMLADYLTGGGQQ